MSQVFKLSGDGLTGLVVNQAHLTAVESLSDEVCLGRIAPEVRPQTIRLEQFVDALAAKPPAAVDWYTKAAPSIARMYLNNRYGCCVISGKAHNLGVWSANDPDSTPDGKVILATDKEISDQYFGVCGPRDAGCNIGHVLNYMVRSGFQAGGQRYKLRGYCAFDWRSKELTQIAIAMGGALSIGFNLPGTWTNSAIWDVSNAGRIIGGHDVSPVGYGPFNSDGPLPPDVRSTAAIAANSEGVIVSSWGRLYLFTWAAWQSTRYIDECYFMVPEFLWTGADKKSPVQGVDLDGLLKAMDLIRGGNIPALPDPPPVDDTPDPPAVVGINMPLPDGKFLKANYNDKTITVPNGWTAIHE